MSPSGEWGATFTAEDGGFALRRFRAGDIPAQHQPAARRAAAWNAEVERARQVVGDLVLTLEKRPLGAALEEADFAPTLDRVPAADDFAAMAAALRAAMAKHYKVNDADPRVFLRRIDLWLDDAAPYLTEHPALILALGGAMAEALPANRGWSAETFTKALSQDVAGETWRRSLEFTLVMPMGAARERIASGLSLSATVAEIAARGKAPIHLVENLRAETSESLIPKEWKDAGLPASVADLTAIRPAMEKLDVANDALNVVALSIASSQKSPAGSELAIWTALRLARNNPADAEALTLLGDTLKDNFYTRAAAAVFRAAALLNPEDPYLRVQSGDALLALSDFDGARAEFAIARSVDTGGSYADQLDQRDTLVGQMEKSEKEGATP